MEIASIIVASISLVALIILIVYLISLKKTLSKGDGSLEMGKLSQKIDSLEKGINTNLQLAISNELLKIKDSDKENSEEANKKLERFQTNIVEQLNARFEHINKELADKMTEINKKVEDKLKEGFQGTTETMAQVRERLQAIDQAQKNIESLSKDVVSLRTIMEGNQTRGQYGEYQLKMVLNNVFGDTIGCYEEQYSIKKSKDGLNDVRADAVVFMPEPNKMICIDSKFPFQDYERMMNADSDDEKEACRKEFAKAVKSHITTIKDKYIIEGKTAKEALMFIPNDGVFAYIHHEVTEAVEYAREKNVILVSPSTLPAILVTINMVRIEAERAKNVQEISKQLAVLGKQFDMFSEEWETFSRQLATASKSREKLDSRVSRITNKFDAISSSSSIGMIEEKEEPSSIDEQ